MGRSIITLRTSGKQLECEEPFGSLLLALESHQVVVEYQCREGYCGSCRIRLLNGNVTYATQPLAFIQQDEILPCCCQAQGDIEIAL